MLKYRNVPVNVSAIIVRSGKILFGKRVQEPRRGRWDLIGGFLEPRESLELALEREIHEETGCTLAAARYLCSAPTRYDGRNILTVHFVCRVRGAPRPTDELTGFVWAKAPPGELAFPSDAEAVRLYLANVRARR